MTIDIEGGDRIQQQQNAVTQLRTQINGMLTQQEAGDYTAALAFAERALIILSTTPNSWFGEERLEWNQASLQGLIKTLESRASAQRRRQSGALIRPIPIIHRRG